MTRIPIFLFSILVAFTACKENGIDVEPFGLRGEVTGTWLPLSEDDTLEVYVNVANNIHLGDPSFEITLIPEAMASSFQVWTDSNYARDSLNVYFPIEIACDTIDNEYICYSLAYIVEYADAKNFRYLGNGYGTDGNELFLNGIRIQGDNGEGF